MFESSNKPTFNSPTANMMEMATRRVISKGGPISPDDKENCQNAENIMKSPETEKKSKSNNGIKINSRAVFNFAGQNKVVFRNHKDSDDEYSTGTRTPMSLKSSKSSLSPNIFSPYREFFNKTNKEAALSSHVADSDDEVSKSQTTTPIRPTTNLNSITEETPTTDSVVTQCTENESESDLDILSSTGLLVHKVCGNDITNQHKRVLYLDPSHTFLFWTDKSTYGAGADDNKKAKLVRNLTRSKSWIKASKQKEVRHDTKRTVLLSNIKEVSVGSGEFSNYVQISTILGRTNKVLIFNIKDSAALSTFLNSLKALEV